MFILQKCGSPINAREREREKRYREDRKRVELFLKFSACSIYLSIFKRPLHETIFAPTIYIGGRLNEIKKREMAWTADEKFNHRMRGKLFPLPRILEYYTNVCIYGFLPACSVSTFKGVAYFSHARLRWQDSVYTSLCAKTNTSNRSNRGHYA